MPSKTVAPQKPSPVPAELLDHIQNRRKELQAAIDEKKTEHAKATETREALDQKCADILRARQLGNEFVTSLQKQIQAGEPAAVIQVVESTKSVGAFTLAPLVQLELLRTQYRDAAYVLERIMSDYEPVAQDAAKTAKAEEIFFEATVCEAIAHLRSFDVQVALQPIVEAEGVLSIDESKGATIELRTYAAKLKTQAYALREEAEKSQVQRKKL